jgi:hypothetical protein
MCKAQEVLHRSRPACVPGSAGPVSERSEVAFRREGEAIALVPTWPQLPLLGEGWYNRSAYLGRTTGESGAFLT